MSPTVWPMSTTQHISDRLFNAHDHKTARLTVAGETYCPVKPEIPCPQSKQSCRGWHIDPEQCREDLQSSSLPTSRTSSSRSLGGTQLLPLPAVVSDRNIDRSVCPSRTGTRDGHTGRTHRIDAVVNADLILIHNRISRQASHDSLPQEILTDR